MTFIDWAENKIKMAFTEKGQMIRFDKDDPEGKVDKN